MNKHLIAVVVLALIFAGFLLYASFPQITGTGVELKLLPVDPFDLIRGQYLTLRYEINQPENMPEMPEGTIVYVVLQEGTDKIHHPVQISQTWPATSKGQIVIKGIAHRNSIEYGIESYFMERGAQLSERQTELTAYVKISSDGSARIVELHKDGKPVKLIYKEGSFLER